MYLHRLLRKKVRATMMDSAPVLRLSQQQITVLLTHLAAYRSYLWQAVIPTPERNQEIRFMQALQGRLSQEQPQTLLSQEEVATLPSVLEKCKKAYEDMPESPQRDAAIGEIQRLLLLFQPLNRKTRALSTSQQQPKSTP